MPDQDVTTVRLKDGTVLHLKGTGLSPEQVSQKVAAYRATQSPSNGLPDTNAQAKAYGTRALTTDLPPVVTPQEGESFAGTMDRGIAAGRQILSDPNKRAMLTSQEGDAAAKAPLALAAASLPGMAAAPLATATGMAGGYLGGKAARGIANIFDASPATQENAEGFGNLAGGVLGAVYGPKAITSAKSAIGRTLFTPEGAKTPLANAIAHPIQRGPEFLMRKVFQPDAAPEYPGGALPSADEFYQNKGSEINDIITRQARLDKAAARSAVPDIYSPAGAPLPSADEFYANEGKLRMEIFKQAAKRGDTNPMNPFFKPEPAEPVPGTPFQPSGKIVRPDSAPPPVNKTLVSYGREELFDMAKKGDLQALAELRRNPAKYGLPPNSKYLMEPNAPTNIYGGPTQ